MPARRNRLYLRRIIDEGYFYNVERGTYPASYVKDYWDNKCVPTVPVTAAPAQKQSRTIEVELDYMMDSGAGKSVCGPDALLEQGLTKKQVD